MSVYSETRGDKPVGGIRGEPAGIGGWLILPAIRVYVSPLFSLIAIAVSFGAVPSIPSRTLIYYFVVAELVGQVGLFLLVSIAAKAFFGLKRSAPGLVILSSVLGSVFTLLDDAAANFVFPDKSFDPIVVLSVGLTLILVLYMQNSRRVRNTFVN
jgi:hypothetical protein